MRGVEFLNSNLFLKIRTQEGSFRLFNHIVRNVNSKMEQAHLNSNLLQKMGQSTPKKGGLKSKLAKLESKTKTFTLSVVKPKTKTKK